MSSASRHRLAALLAGPRADLAEANLLLAAEARPDLDLEAELGRVDALAAEARARGGDAEAVVGALRDAGLRGDREDYDDPRNSFLNEVLDRGLGLPIALSALTVAVADRVGVPMAGVGAPGHFVVADLSGPVPRYLDAFDGWATLGVDDLGRRVAAAAAVRLAPEHLRPVGPRPIVRRMLANLEASYGRRARPADQLWTVELARLAAPGDPDLPRREAVLLSALGRYDEADVVIDRLLAELPPGPARDGAAAQRRAIEEMRWRMN